MNAYANPSRAALALTVVLASCGGDDNQNTNGNAATAGSTAGSTAGGTGGGGGASATCNDDSWNVRIKDNGPFDSWVTGVVSDASCGVVVAGSVSVDLPGPDSLSPLLVAAYDAAGTLRWSRTMGDNPQTVHVALDADRNILVAASFDGTPDFGGGALPSAGGHDVYIAKLDPTGQHLWSKRFGDTSNQNPGAIAADSAGNVLVAGSFYGSVDLGTGALVAAGDGSESDVFVAKFGPDGAPLWNKRFGGLEFDRLTGLAVDASGALVIAGRSYDAIDLGGGPLDNGLGDDVWIGKLDAAGGHVWSFAFAQSYFSPVIATDSLGAVYLAGAPFSSSLMIHGGTSVSGDLLLAKLGADGGLLWAKGFGQGGQSTIETIAAIAVDSAGNVVLTGAIEGVVDFGGGALPYIDDGNGVGDIFAAKLDPQGAHVASATFGEGSGRAATVDTAGSVLIAGTVKGHADFGHGEYQTGSSVFDEAFLAKLSW